MGVCVSSKDNNPHLNNKSQKKNNGIVNNTNTIQQSHKEEIVKKEETVKTNTIVEANVSQIKEDIIKKETDKTDKVKQLTREEILFSFTKTSPVQIYHFNKYSTATKGPFSIENDFTKAISSSQSKDSLYPSLLSLNQRQWIKESITLASNISLNRSNMDNYVLNKYLKSIVQIHSHFKLLIEAISEYFNDILLTNTKRIFKEDYTLPSTVNQWLSGFEWKGLFIKASTREESKELIDEVKALSYLYFDYVQIIDNCSNYDDSSNLLSSEIVFPLIGYAKTSGIVISVSAVILQSDKDSNEIDIHSMSKNDLKQSLIFTKLIEEHKDECLFKLYEKCYSKNPLSSENKNKFKYMVINARRTMPLLFENINDMNIIHFWKDNTFNFYIPNYSQEKSPTEVLDTAYNISYSAEMKSENVISNGIEFKILFKEDENNTSKKTFIDYLMNNYLYINEEKLTKDSIRPMNINKEYVVMFRMKNDIMLKYSLIKMAKDSKGNELLKSHFNYRCGFVSHFESWCKMCSLNNFNITSLSSLKNIMHRYGINMSLIFFSMINIEMNISTHLTENLISLMKIAILTKVIQNYVDEAQGNSLIFSTSFNRTEYITKVINCILYPSEENKIDSVYSELLYFIKLKEFKWKLIDYYLQIGVFCTEQTAKYTNAKIFLLDLLQVARDHPFLFLKCIEERLHCSFSSFNIFKYSISVESYGKKFDANDITLQRSFSLTYINPSDISSYLLARTISTMTEDIITIPTYNNEIAKAIQLNSIQPKISINNMNRAPIEETNIDSNSFRQNSNNVTNINKTHDESQITNFDTKCEWKDIIDKFSITLSPMVYKMKFHFDSSLPSLIYKHLSNSYTPPSIASVLEWISSCESVFDATVNGIEIIKSKVYSFIYFFYFDPINKIEKTKQIIKEIESLLSQKCFFDISNELTAVINLIEGLAEEGYLKSEEYYSRCLILTLLSYGDARGRHNDSNGFALFPLWKIARKTSILDNSIVINENFKEMFHCFDYYFKMNNRRFNLLRYKKNIDYTMNQRKNIDMILQSGMSNERRINTTNSVIVTESVNFMNEDIDERPSMNRDIEKNLALNNDLNYHADIIDKEVIKSLTFLPISLQKSKSKILIEKFFSSKDFLLFIIKQIRNFVSISSSTKPVAYYRALNYLTTSTENTPQQAPKKYGNSFSHFINDELIDQLSFKKNIMNNVVVAFGNNSHGETTHDNYDMLDIPRVSFKLKNEKIRKIFCGWDNSLAINEDGEVLAWGNNKSYQCGVEIKEDDEKTKSISTPINITKAHNAPFKCIDASCGNEHTLVLSQEGEVYGFGLNVDGVLGIENNFDYKISNFTKIHFDEKIKSISCGTVHNLALSQTGKVYSWGSAQGGQLGQSEKFLTSQPDFATNLNISKPTVINLPQKMTMISAGEAHSMSLAESSRVYTWGFGSNGQLGLHFCEDSYEPGTGMSKSRVLTPQLMFTFTEKVKTVKCGKTFTMFITDNDELYGCGVNDLYQLGIGDNPPNDHLYRKDMQCYDFVIPTRIESLLSMKVEKIACGEGHCLAVVREMNSGVCNLWSWGNNKYGQLGIGKKIKKSLPKPISWMMECNRYWKIEDVACGGFHSLCLLKRVDSDEENKEKNNMKVVKKCIENLMI